MYDNCSEQYWKNKKKRRQRPGVILIASLGFLLLLVSAVLVATRSRSTSAKGDSKVEDLLPLRQRKLVASEVHFKICAEHFKTIQNSAQNECLMICSEERTSVPRPTMYQACIHGCNNALFRSAEISCNGGTQEKVFDEVELHSYRHCSRFEGLRPRIELVSTCRKYYDIASKQGFVSAKTKLEKILESDGCDPQGDCSNHNSTRKLLL